MRTGTKGISPGGGLDKPVTVAGSDEREAERVGRGGWHSARKLRLAILAATATAALTTAGCDLLMTDPAPASTEVAVAFQVVGDPLGGAAAAFSRVRRIRLTFTRPDGQARDTAIGVSPVAGIIRVPIVIRTAERVENLDVVARLGYGLTELFRGGATVRVEPGSPTSAQIELAPVPASVQIDRQQVSLLGPGALQPLSHAVLFASGDTIGGAQGVWTSLDPTIATVTAGGVVRGVALGQTEIEARLDTLADTVSVDVLPPAPTGGVRSWVGGDGAWSDPASWGGAVPAAGDTVEISLVGTYTVTLDADPQPLAALRIGAAAGTQTLATTAGRTIVVAGDVSLSGSGRLALTGTSLDAAAVTIGPGTILRAGAGTAVTADITNHGDLVADDGTVSVTGSLTTTVTSSVRVGAPDRSAVLTLSEAFVNDGLVELSPGGTLETLTGTLVNQPPAALSAVTSPLGLDATLRAPLDNQGTLTAAVPLVLDATGARHSNSGSWTMTAGADLTITGADGFVNSGSLDVGTGTFDITFAPAAAGFTTSGAIDVEGTVIVRNGPFALSAGRISGGGLLRLLDLSATFTPPVTLGTDLPTIVQSDNATLTAPSLTTVAGTALNIAQTAVTGSVANAGQFTASGGANTITGSYSSADGSTASVTGNVAGETSLSVTAGLTNGGSLLLQNAVAGADTRLRVTGGDLVNQATGVINTVADAFGGSRTIEGQWDNAGFVDARGSMVLDGSGGATFANGGSITTNDTGPITITGIDAFSNTGIVNAALGPIGIGLSGTGAGFTNNGALIVAAGTSLVVHDGDFTNPPGGSIGGTGGPFILRNANATWLAGTTLGVSGPPTLELESTTLTIPFLDTTDGSSLRLEASTVDGDMDQQGLLVVGEGASQVLGTLTTAATSVIRVQGGATLPARLDVGAFTNAGSIELGSDGTGDATLDLGGGVLTNGTGATVTSVATPSAGGVRSIEADLVQTGAVVLAAPLTVTGSLDDPVGVPSSYLGNGNTLTVSGLNVSGPVLDDMPVISVGGTLTAFADATFQNMDPTGTQLSISHPGTLASPLSFTGLLFATTPTGAGLYVSLTDTDPLSLPLTVEILASTPASGLALSAVFGGATLIW